MFIPTDESNRRLASESNLVNRLARSTSLAPELQPLPPDPLVLPTSSLEPIEPEQVETPKLDKDVARALSSDPVIADAAMERLLSPKAYKGQGPKHLTDDFRASMAVAGDLIGSRFAQDLGGVTNSTVWAHRHAQNSQHAVGVKEPREILREKIIEGHGIVIDRCFNRLLKTLDLLDDTKLEGVKRASELSVIGKNLSGIIAHASNATQDKYVDNKEQSVHFHIMRPEQGSDADYPTIEISPEASPDRPKDFEP